MSRDNSTVALVALDQGTLNFVPAITTWDGQGVAPFTTAQIRDLAAVLCNHNFLKVFETGKAATDTVRLIRAEVTRLETKLKEQKADSIQQQMENDRLT